MPMRWGVVFERDMSVPTFHDIGIVANWAREAVTALQQAGIIQGVGGGLFEPLRNSNRVGVASMITNFHRRYVDR